MEAKLKEMKLDVYPLNGVDLKSEVFIKDHINLSGSSPRNIGFIPITDIYSYEGDAIIVAFLKEGIVPSKEEQEALKKAGVSAYSYSAIQEILSTAAIGAQIKASAVVPKLPEGFTSAGIEAGIKASKKKDLGLIISDSPCNWAGVFTTNKVRAACVDQNKELLGKTIRAVVCNAGNANACTGEAGAQVDLEIRAAVAQKHKIKAEEVLVASTGVIGQQLDIELIQSGLAKLQQNNKTSNVQDFAHAILTTDLTTKIYQSKNILGFTKGSGMIHPNMATMLAFLVTGIYVEGLADAALNKILKDLVDQTFNCISVDGDTSTNDMVLFLTNKKGKAVSEAEFKAELFETCQALARKIVLDGEGATKLMEINIKNAASPEDARLVGKSIAGSSLVKTAVFGCDPNWGRIIAAIGYADIAVLEPKEVSMSILGHSIFEKGQATELSMDPEKSQELSKLMKKNHVIDFDIDLGAGKSSAQILASDLSYDYVTINSQYTT